MKVIFLDIDGVLNSTDYLESLYMAHEKETEQIPHIKERWLFKESFSKDEHGLLFDLRCCNHLRYIIDQTDAKIVISSTWRKNGIDKMRAMWKGRNLPGEIIDITPTLYNEVSQEELSKIRVRREERGTEVQMWLDENEVDNYVIIDDDRDFLNSQRDYCVFTHHKYGLTASEAIKAKSILLL